MIRPPRGDCSFMIRNASWVHRNTPVRLMSTTACHCSMRQIFQRDRRGADAGVVEQQVQAAEALLHIVEQRGDLAGSATSVGRTRTARPVTLLGGLMQPVLAPAGQHQGPAGFAERDRDGASDAGTGAGDERDLGHVVGPSLVGVFRLA